MQKWEYLDLPIVIKEETILPNWVSYRGGKLNMKTVGQQGWELASVDNGIAYFKRPLQEETKPVKIDPYFLLPKW